jgi:hypothetical protein
MIFDVKMEDFRRNARFVAGGHTTDTPHTMIYASVVSKESVRIALTLAALNDVDVNMADIENAYLTAPLTEKVWTVLGPEFGDDSGKCALIVRALYGLKSAVAAFRNHLAEYMKHLGWHSCRADRDLWMKAETRPDDGVSYWAYILIHVDAGPNLLLVSQIEEGCLSKWRGCMGHELQQVCTVCCPECQGISGSTSRRSDAGEESIWPICRGIQA